MPQSKEERTVQPSMLARAEEIQQQYDQYREHIDKSQAFRTEIGEAPAPEFTPHLQEALATEEQAKTPAPVASQQRKIRGEEHRY